jgi:MFS family permease
MALALTILGDILSPRERTKYQAAFFAVFGVASVLGPVLGGFFAGADDLLGLAGWRWIFLINVPLGAIAMVVILRVLHLPHTRRGTRIDWWGVGALVLALVPLLIVVEQGREWGWTSPLVLSLTAAVAVGTVLFLVAERAAGDNALLPLRLFRIPTVAVSTGVNFIMGFAMFGGLAGLPLYLQISKGMTPTQAGLAMLPFTFGILTMAMVGSRAIRRTGRYRWLPIMGTAVLVVAGLVLSTLTAASPLAHLFGGSFLFGLGLGSIMQPLMLAVQNAVSPRDMGTGTSSVMFFRQIGGSLGTAVFLALLFGSVQARIGEEFAAAAQTAEFQQAVADPAVVAPGSLNAVVAEVVASGSLDDAEAAGLSLDDTSFIQELHPVLAAPFEEGFADSITWVLAISALITLLAFALTWLLPELPLREKSGLETIADEEAAAGV